MIEVQTESNDETVFAFRAEEIAVEYLGCGTHAMLVKVLLGGTHDYQMFKDLVKEFLRQGHTLDVIQGWVKLASEEVKD